MIEYLDKGLLIMSFFILFSYIGLCVFSEKSKNLTIGLVVLFTISLLSNIVITVSNYNQSTKSMNYFIAGNTIYCKNKSSNYKVSKYNNWQLEKNYFVKDSLMIRANNCKFN